MNSGFRKVIPGMLLCVASFETSAQEVNIQLKQYLSEAQAATTGEAYVRAMEKADSFAKKISDVESQAKINRNLGGYYFDKDADKSISYTRKAQQLFMTSGNKKDAALCLNNIAFAYQEQKEDYKEALNYSRKAINAHTELNDTLGMANVYKFQAMLYGKLHEFAKGKKSAKKAIDLFKAKNHVMGMAVSYRDLAIVYEEEGEHDSAIAWMLRAKEIWNGLEHKENFKWRVYGINTDLVRMYAATDKDELSAQMIEENEAITGEIHYSEKIRFYKECKEYYKKRDKDKASAYKEKYTTTRDSLKEAGVKVKDK